MDNIQLDLAYIGGLVIDAARARGIAQAAQQALAEREARIAQLEAEVEKLKAAAGP